MFQSMDYKYKVQVPRKPPSHAIEDSLKRKWMPKDGMEMNEFTSWDDEGAWFVWFKDHPPEDGEVVEFKDHKKEIDHFYRYRDVKRAVVYFT